MAIPPDEGGGAGAAEDPRRRSVPAVVGLAGAAVEVPARRGDHHPGRVEGVARAEGGVGRADQPAGGGRPTARQKALRKRLAGLLDETAEPELIRAEREEEDEE